MMKVDLLGAFIENSLMDLDLLNKGTLSSFFNKGYQVTW